MRTFKILAFQLGIISFWVLLGTMANMIGVPLVATAILTGVGAGASYSFGIIICIEKGIF